MKGRAELTLTKSLTLRTALSGAFGAAAIGGLIYDRLLEQGKGIILDFIEYYDEQWTLTRNSDR